MITYIVYDSVSGEIVRYGQSSNEAAALAQAVAGEIVCVVEDANMHLSDKKMKVEEGQLVWKDGALDALPTLREITNA